MAIVAVFNSNDDTVDLLRMALEEEGFETVTAHVPDVQRGRLDLVEFVDRHRPAVIVYDVPPPYDRSWNFLRLVRTAAGLRHVPFVLTTTNKRALDELVGPNDAIEILGKPYDLEQVVRAVRRAIEGSTPATGPA